MDSSPNRFESRMIRERHNSNNNNNNNPFHSPPSSTGTHGTVTMTSDISYGPEGESTRRVEDDDSIKIPALRNSSVAHKAGYPSVSTSALGQPFPEWNANYLKQTNEIRSNKGKENVRPSSSSTHASFREAKEYQSHLGYLRTRAKMQARADNESDCGSDKYTPRGKTTKDTNQKTTAAGQTNVTNVIKNLMEAQKLDPLKRPARPSTTPQIQTSDRRSASPTTWSQTARSFFIPNLGHVHDFVSGALKFSTAKNGIPVFVKDGKVHDRHAKSSPGHHREVEAFEIPEDEQKIFVSIDELRGQIQALQEHDDHISKQAEQLQDENDELQIELLKLKSKSRKDSAMGSDSENSMIDHSNATKSLNSLQAKLEETSRKLSTNEVNTSRVVGERDAALEKITDQMNTIIRLQSELDAAREELRSFETEGVNLRQHNRSVRQELQQSELQSHDQQEEILRLKETIVAMHDDQEALQEENRELQEEIQRLKEEIEALKRTINSMESDYEEVQTNYDILAQKYTKYTAQSADLVGANEELRKKTSKLESQKRDLTSKYLSLQSMLDTTNTESGKATYTIKDVRNQQKITNQDKDAENFRLRNKIADMTAERTKDQSLFNHERKRLNVDLERLNDKVNQLSIQMEQTIRGTRAEAIKCDDEQISLVQQLLDLENASDDGATLYVKELMGRFRQKIQDRKEMNRVARDMEDIRKSTAESSATKAAKNARILDTGTSARSTTTHSDLPMQEDFTQQIDLIQGSQQEFTEEKVYEEAPMTEEMSVEIKTKSAASRAQSGASKKQPVGILKNARFTPEQDMTGRFSVKSTTSDISMPTSSRVTRAIINDDTEENMTSALFIDDITLDTRKGKATEKRKAKKPVPELSSEAKRVLDGLCHDHSCQNCTVCAQIYQNGPSVMKIHVKKPTPVTDRVPNPAEEYEDGPTIRPVHKPGDALAMAMKYLKDDIRHLKRDLEKRQAKYNKLDPAFDKRTHKALAKEIARLMRTLDARHDVVYNLYDVLEGQKKDGQQMSQDEMTMQVKDCLSKDRTLDSTLGGMLD